MGADVVREFGAVCDICLRPLVDGEFVTEPTPPAVGCAHHACVQMLCVKKIPIAEIRALAAKGRN